MAKTQIDGPSLKSLLRSRFRGTLIGGALGDALGFPYEGSSSSFMEALDGTLTSEFGTHRSGYFPAGQYSDDTQMTLATVEAILDVGDVSGEAIARAFVPLWRENAIVGRGAACTESIERLIRGEADWRTCGAEEGRAGNGAAMRAAPIGLWDHDRPDDLLRHIEDVSRITHHDPRAVAGAAAVAAAVAYNLTHREIILGELLDQVAVAAGRFHRPFGEWVLDMPRYLSLREEETVTEFLGLGVEEPFEPSPDGLTPFVVPTVMLALYYFLRTPHDYETTIHCCLRLGGDVDTLASIAGSISGSCNGVEELPAELQAQLLHKDRIIEVADSLYSKKLEERARSRR